MDQKLLLQKAARYCAYRERCHSELAAKLKEWGVYGKHADAAMAEMINLGFLNEERFARLFAGGKFRIKQWGKVKITHELKKKAVTPYCIQQGLNEIDDEDYLKTLKKILGLEGKKEISKLPRVLYPLAKKAIAKGFEPNLVWEILRNH